MDNLIKNIDNIGKIALLLTGVTGNVAGFIATINAIIERARQPKEDGTEKTKEEVIAEIEAAIAELGTGIDELQKANDFYFTLPEPGTEN